VRRAVPHICAARPLSTLLDLACAMHVDCHASPAVVQKGAVADGELDGPTPRQKELQSVAAVANSDNAMEGAARARPAMAARGTRTRQAHAARRCAEWAPAKLNYCPVSPVAVLILISGARSTQT